MTSPTACICGTFHMGSCPGPFTLCIAQGFVFEDAIMLVTKSTGLPLDWPVGTSTRIRFSWGTGTELIIAGTVDGPYLRFLLTAAQTEMIPKGALAVIDVNYDAGDPLLWRPWRKARVASCQ